MALRTQPLSELYAFTIFTPTYNRAHTIHRVFESLRAQTLRDFEWIVVDDGSIDNTAQLIEEWAKTADFPIRYFRKSHAGKHVAHNLAAREARGTFFLPLDSDDGCPPQALERMLFHWNAIPENERRGFSGVSGLCFDQHGDLIGEKYPADPFDSTLRERHYVNRLRGEKWGSTLTCLVRRFPFPEIAGTNFTPEGVVWLEISKTYKDRCVNEVFRIYYVDDDATGATLTGQRALRETARGRLYYYIWLLNNDLDYFFRAPRPFLKAAVMLPIAARFAGEPIIGVIKSLHSIRAKALVLFTLPMSEMLRIFGGETLIR